MKNPMNSLLNLFTLWYTYELLRASTNSMKYFFKEACKPLFDCVQERDFGLKIIDLSAQICVWGVTDE
jgi:hypothetical protein